MQPPELSQATVAKLLYLLDVEEIRTLKFKYAQLMDKLDIDGLAELFTDDAKCNFGPYGEWSGKEVIRNNYRAAMADVVTAPWGSLHHICNHWVELTSETTAVGRSYLIDVIAERAPDVNPVLCYALYDEEYRKVNGNWKISFSCIQFLWPEKTTNNTVLASFPPPQSE